MNEIEIEEVEENEDRDFSVWLAFFVEEKPSLTKFISLLKEKDTYFLNHPLEVDFDDELYEKILPSGFLEKDFQEILGEEDSDCIYYKTRLAIAMSHGLIFELMKKRIGVEKFNQVIEKTLIEGHYEKFDIKFEKLIAMAIEKLKLPKDSLIDVSFVRGVNLAKRYPDIEFEEELKNIILENKMKVDAGI
jgi:hypothetical protein